MAITYVALLRAVNIGGRSLVPMGALRDLAAGLGLEEPRTLLQSGNLVFRATRTTNASLERMLEEGLSARLGVATAVIVRTADEWRGVVERNPFPREAKADPGHLLVMALKHAVKTSDVDTLRTSIKGREVVAVEGAQLYLVYPDGVGRSRLTVVAIEKAIGARGTARNWNTVLKLAALASEPALKTRQ